MSSFVVDAIRSAAHRAERIVDLDDDWATARTTVASPLDPRRPDRHRTPPK